MAATQSQNVIEVNPQQAWSGLQNSTDTVLVDVRTRPEWSFIGVPDLASLSKQVILLEWRMYPDMSVNDRFVTDLLEQFEGSIPSEIYFLCRSGVRSLEAANVVNQVLSANNHAAQCINVLEGFEGDLNPAKHRGLTNGWKARGLAWGQT